MSDKVIGSLVIAVGVLAAIGILPIRIGLPPQSKPMKFAAVSRIGAFLFAATIGIGWGWSSSIPQRYWIFLLVPFLVGFILIVGGQAMEKRVNLGAMAVVAVVVVFGFVLWSYFHH